VELLDSVGSRWQNRPLKELLEYVYGDADFTQKEFGEHLFRYPRKRCSESITAKTTSIVGHSVDGLKEPDRTQYCCDSKKAKLAG
jgi:hypothetical protein